MRLRRSSPVDLTPQTIVHAARIAVLAIGVGAIHGYLGGALNDHDAGEIAVALGLAMLVAAPCEGRGELLGAVAIWLTTCEFMAASQTGHFALQRWGSALGALGLMLVVIWVCRFRALARANPWQSLREPVQYGPAHGPGAAWQARGMRDQAPAALADIEGRARWVKAGSSRSA
jgi:hypothetical protein